MITRRIGFLSVSIMAYVKLHNFFVKSFFLTKFKSASRAIVLKF